MKLLLGWTRAAGTQALKDPGCCSLLLCLLCLAVVQLRALLAAHPDSPAAVLLKGQLEVMRQQPKKALKTVAPLLAAASQATVR
jgi:predicted Zn-dependent protease